mmetsp:Transcript_45927/g.73538  ORF Transcript_45927/g.73538 Transcript_45927/m.73538 type:complete len:460 (-) Transcript_45927:148-1527(-)
MSSARSPRSPGEPSMTDFSASHLDVEGTGVDGSGAVAIKMIHTDSTWTIIADVIRLVFSICLLIFSTIMTLYAIATSTTTMPGTIPPWAQYLLLGIALMVLGVLEGLQIGVVELAHKDPNRYRKLYPRAARLLAFENKGRNVERFLMGRQVLVVGTVFIAARITTFDGVWDAIHGLTFSGFLGVVLVVIVAQLTPQVLAAAYPTEFMNLPGMKIAFWACLLVEATGLVHAVWFLCVVVKKGCYKCVCAVSDDDDDVKFDRVASKSAMRGLKRHRDDDDDEDDDDEDENDVLSVEYEDSESMDEDEESEEGDDEYEWMMQHDDYEMYRNEQIFQLEVSEQVQGIDYVNTVSWIWNAHGCDEKVLSFVHMSLCTNATKDGQNKNDIVISTKPVDDDLEAAIQWNVRNQMDWEQIYEVKMQDRQTNMRLCKTLAMIKLCVEMTEDEYVTGNIKEMQMSAEFV